MSENSSAQKKTLFGSALIWFGAAVSIAEIMTGALLAPLGFGKAAAAILGGHIVGCALLYCAGLIGARHSLSAMECVKCSFGSRGGIFFAVLNLVQLVGWSAVMISAGANSACGIWHLPFWLWACIIGLLILVWIALKSGELKILNSAAVLLLFTLTVILSITVFRHGGVSGASPESTLSFGEALELSIAMPLSWLPLIGDYTCDSSRPKVVSTLSALVYFFVSSWMYFIGLGAALYAGNSDVAQILSRAGLGIPALLIVIFSTVTTTYLDVYSSEMSMGSITQKIPPIATGIAVCVIGVLAAIFCSTGAFEGFLYWIGSVFAPMIAILIADFFILKKADAAGRKIEFSSLLIWGAGFILYRILLEKNPVCGSTLPVMAFTALLRILCVRLKSRGKRC